MKANPLSAQSLPGLRFASVIQLEGAQLPLLLHVPLERLVAYACSESSCGLIPMQVDERDAAGRWVLDQGPTTNVDDEPGRLDANDMVMFYASDGGSLPPAHGLPEAPALYQVSIRDPLDGSMRYIYLVAQRQPRTESLASYVHYDPTNDRAEGRHVGLGYAAGVPGYLSVDDGVNLLDRLKVRADASFLFGLIHFTRSEADLQTQVSGWRAGPIRIVRGQEQRVRLGWGIRSPTFVSYTFFYRDFAELPVGFRLNFPPTYFFSGIHVRVVLDFRDLRGWQVEVPGNGRTFAVDGSMNADKRALSQRGDKWIALRGPETTLLQGIELSPSLASVRRRLWYRESLSAGDPPEDFPGELPGVGYGLDHWEEVSAGLIWLQATSYALPADVDVAQFVDALQRPLDVQVRPYP
ncbi:MAG: hypothetical protein HY270_09505 [Deltaproteobacteria bacterium]|nr:hypothetical protein [Deltaproteobacteria bacterium]